MPAVALGLAPTGPAVAPTVDAFLRAVGGPRDMFEVVDGWCGRAAASSPS